MSHSLVSEMLLQMPKDAFPNLTGTIPHLACSLVQPSTHKQDLFPIWKQKRRKWWWGSSSRQRYSIIFNKVLFNKVLGKGKQTFCEASSEYSLRILFVLRHLTDLTHLTRWRWPVQHLLSFLWVNFFQRWHIKYHIKITIGIYFILEWHLTCFLFF